MPNSLHPPFKPSACLASTRCPDPSIKLNVIQPLLRVLQSGGQSSEKRGVESILQPLQPLQPPPPSPPLISAERSKRRLAGLGIGLAYHLHIVTTFSRRRPLYFVLLINLLFGFWERSEWQPCLQIGK